ncbi:MAG: hypothetical protein AAF988_04940 [Pseudomonadota bacterium]
MTDINNADIIAAKRLKDHLLGDYSLDNSEQDLQQKGKAAFDVVESQESLSDKKKRSKNQKWDVEANRSDAFFTSRTSKDIANKFNSYVSSIPGTKKHHVEQALIEYMDNHPQENFTK